LADDSDLERAVAPLAAKVIGRRRLDTASQSQFLFLGAEAVARELY
jgi:hypothetical protein